MTVNGEAVRYRLDPETPLLWALRDASNLTGAKYGCDSGDCGACTVLVDGHAVKSCQPSIASLEGAEIVTIEGLSSGRAHPLQQAWASEQVSLCGMCDPGFIMALAALMKVSPRPSPQELEALPNLCRCGAGPAIVRAVARAGENFTTGIRDAARAAGSPAPDQTPEDPLRTQGNFVQPPVMDQGGN